MVLDVVLEAVGGVAEAVTRFAGAPLAEVIPGEDSVLMAVVPVEVDGVVTDRGDLGGAELRLKDGQRGGNRRRRLVGLAMALFALFGALGAGTGIAQVGKAVGALVAVFPDDFHGGAAGFMDLDGGGLDCAHDD